MLALGPQFFDSFRCHLLADFPAFQVVIDFLRRSRPGNFIWQGWLFFFQVGRRGLQIKVFRAAQSSQAACPCRLSKRKSGLSQPRRHHTCAKPETFRPRGQSLRTAPWLAPAMAYYMTILCRALMLPLLKSVTSTPVSFKVATMASVAGLMFSIKSTSGLMKATASAASAASAWTRRMVGGRR